MIPDLALMRDFVKSFLNQVFSLLRDRVFSLHGQLIELNFTDKLKLPNHFFPQRERYNHLLRMEMGLSILHNESFCRIHRKNWAEFILMVFFISEKVQVGGCERIFVRISSKFFSIVASYAHTLRTTRSVKNF